MTQGERVVNADSRRAVFQHCPRCARAGFSAGDGPDLRCAGCGLRYFLNPAVAAGAVIRDDGARVLLIRRARDPGRGKLALPGGFVDAGESAEAAVRREIREELGLSLEDVSFLVSAPNLYTFAGVTYPVLDLFFTAAVPSLDILMKADEVHAYELRPPATVAPEELAFPSHRIALAALERRP